MNPNPNHIFVDTNVLIGAYSNDENDKRCLHFVTNNVRDYRKFVNINILKPVQIRTIQQ